MAGKTGTNANFRDAWFVGFTPDLVTAVWLGNDDYSRMNESYGGNIPARTWARFMRAALQKVPKHDFPFPTGEVVKVARCAGSSKLGAEYYLAGTEPLTSCSQNAKSIDVNAYQAPETAGTPAVTGTVKPNHTQPPNSVGDGTTFEKLDTATAPP